MFASLKESIANSNEFRLNHEDAEKFYQLSYEVFDEWHSAVIAAKATPGFYVPPYSGYPEIIEISGAFPKYQTMWQSKPEMFPRRYSCLLPHGGDPPISLLSPTKKVINEGQSTSFDVLVGWVLSHATLSIFFEPLVNEITAEKVVRNTIGASLALSVEFYIRHHDNDDANKERFKKVFEPFARTILLKRICISAIVPILGITFLSRRFRLTRTSFVIKMSPHLQKSRSIAKDYSGNTDDTLAQLATHALVLRKWSIENDNLIKTRFSLRQQFHQILNRVECFFGVLRLVDPASTGYSQVLYRPQKAEINGFSDLISLQGIQLRGYPSELSELRYSSKPVKTITRNSLEKIKQLLAVLEELNENSIYLAVRRLNKCFVREDGDDALIDAAIGIELLLGDNSTEATSYKLRMRAAALSKVSGNRFAALEMKKRVEYLYNARSKLVHGRPPKGTVSLVNNSDAHRTDVIAARNVLRDLIWTLIENPKYLKTENIESDLMLG
jgi:hypothetical protein